MCAETFIKKIYKQKEGSSHDFCKKYKQISVKNSETLSKNSKH